PMIAGLCETLVGYFVDRDVGPMVMLAVGGVTAEFHRDRSLRLAPVDPDEAWYMIEEVEAIKAYSRPRGQLAADLDALADAIVKLSGIADDPSVIEAEINPLILKGSHEGAVAVDVLVRVAG